MKKISIVVLIVAILVCSVSAVSFAQAPAGSPPQETMGQNPQNHPMDQHMQGPEQPQPQSQQPAPAPKPEGHPHHDSSVVKLVAALLLLDAIK